MNKRKLLLFAWWMFCCTSAAFGQPKDFTIPQIDLADLKEIDAKAKAGR